MTSKENWPHTYLTKHSFERRIICSFYVQFNEMIIIKVDWGK